MAKEREKWLLPRNLKMGAEVNDGWLLYTQHEGGQNLEREKEKRKTQQRLVLNRVWASISADCPFFTLLVKQMPATPMSRQCECIPCGMPSLANRGKGDRSGKNNPD